MRILVVDDEEAGRYLATTILLSAGHEVDGAVDGIDALEKARAQRPDVVLSDILMPRMDGYHLVREWKADPELADIPIVFYTASYTDPADEKFALDLGVDGFLSKPVEINVLLRTLSDVVEGGGRPTPRRPRTDDESVVLREYSERLVHKLEEKVADLERSNTMLEQAMRALGDEVEVKQGLIEDLDAEVVERKRSEDELRAERDFSARIIDTAQVIILGLDLDSRIRLFSPGAERITGWTADEVLGSEYFRRFVPEDVRELRAAQLERLLRTRSSTHYEGAILTREGEQRVIEWSGTVSTDSVGEVDGALMVGIDVTERMMAAAVERTMARIDLAVLLDRPRSEVLDVTCERLVAEFGYLLAFVMLQDVSAGRLEVMALSGQLARHFDDLAGGMAPQTMCPVEDAMARDEVTVVTLEDVKIADNGADLVTRGAQAAAAIPLRAHGVTVGAIGLVTGHQNEFQGPRGDTLRRLADRVAIGILVAEGREQMGLQSAALESAGNGIVIADIAGVVRWVNPAFSELTGFGFDEAVGEDIRARDGEAPSSSETSAYREPLYRDAWRAVEAGRVWRGEFTNTSKDGSTYLEDVTLAPVRDEHGAIKHVVIVKQDLTEKRALEQLKSSFAAVVSHELRTPLTSVIGYADLLSQSAKGLAPPANAALGKLRSNAHRMQDLVERLLEVTQMEAEGVTLDLETCDIREVIDASISELAVPEGVRIDTDVAPGVGEVRCDMRQISRAIGNILDNAIKYSPGGGVVTVSISGADDSVLVSVRDEGEGMPPDRIPGVFDRFTQLDMSDTRRFGGMGIGLFVAYSIVHAHGGTIMVSSQPGAGSTFTLRLPATGPAGYEGHVGVEQDRENEPRSFEG